MTPVILGRRRAVRYAQRGRWREVVEDVVKGKVVGGVSKGNCDCFAKDRMLGGQKRLAHSERHRAPVFLPPLCCLDFISFITRPGNNEGCRMAV